jgi:hypothetical protein
MGLIIGLDENHGTGQAPANEFGDGIGVHGIGVRRGRLKMMRGAMMPPHEDTCAATCTG